MQKFLVMTDLHLKPEGERIIGLDPGARLTEALDHALRRHPDAAALVLAGDLTHAGTPAEYDRLAALLAGVPVPVIPTVGNHDNRDAFRAAFPDAPATPEGHVQAWRDLGDTRLIVLDTLIGPPFGWTHLGRLDAARRAWLDAALADAGPAVVVAHHPPHSTGLPSMDALMLEDGDWLIDRLRAHPHPVHLILGHLHRTVSGSARGVPFTVLKGTCHQGVLDLESMDSTLSVDEPGAYGVVLVGGGLILVHSEDVLPEKTAISGY